MSDAIASTPRRPRMTWMDTLRGTAIILVIMWHAAAILRLFDVPAPHWLLLLNETMAPYRMPTLMFLSGMLLNRSLAKPLPVYLTGKLRHIAWPWFLWSLLNLVIMQPAGGPFAFATWAFSYLWFLAYIMVYYLIAPLVQRIPAPLVALAFGLFSFVVAEDENRRKFCFLAIFFFLGRWASENRDWLMRTAASPKVWYLAPVALGFGAASAWFGPWRYQSILVLFSLAGILVAIKCAIRFNGPRSEPLQFVGRNSLIYYVTHFPVIVLVVRAADAMGLDSRVIIPTGLVMALAVGTVAARLSATTPLRWLFEIPPPAARTRPQPPVEVTAGERPA